MPRTTSISFANSNKSYSGYSETEIHDWLEEQDNRSGAIKTALGFWLKYRDSVQELDTVEREAIMESNTAKILDILERIEGEIGSSFSTRLRSPDRADDAKAQLDAMMEFE